MRGGKPQKRPPGIPTPCATCPKGSPELSKARELTWRNLATLRLFTRNRAMQGRGLTRAELQDGWLARQFEIIDLVLRRFERVQATEAMIQAFQSLR